MKQDEARYFTEVMWDALKVLRQPLIDCLVGAGLWLLLYLFHFLPLIMPVPGPASWVILRLHEWGTVIVMGNLFFHLVTDVFQQRKLGGTPNV